MPRGINPGPARKLKVAKLYQETHTKVAELAITISRRGWESFGVDRSDVPTVAAIVDAAIELLIERGQPAKGRKKEIAR